MLRIGDRRFPREHAEELGVEHVDIRELRPGWNVVCGSTFLVSECVFDLVRPQFQKGIPPLTDEIPKRLHRRSAREPTGHADDRNAGHVLVIAIRAAGVVCIVENGHEALLRKWEMFFFCSAARSAAVIARALADDFPSRKSANS